MVGPVAAGFLAADSEVVAGAPPGMMESLVAAAPMRRLGHPSDIAGIAAFLATPRRCLDQRPNSLGQQ